VLLDRVREREAGNAIAERIICALREPIDIAGKSITISASAGLRFGSGADGSEELLSDADAAMYEAKTHGKNRYLVFEASMRSRVVERTRFTMTFMGALDRGEFVLDYQPSFGLVDGRLHGFEALVRWQHPTLGLVPPERFIPLAEETGFILPLGRWVLETACLQAVTWPAAEDGSPAVSVNVSALQLGDGDLLADVRTALARSGLPATRLVLEITESMLVSDTDHTLAVLDELRRMGVRVGIDDFGTGYSSLSEVSRLPVDFVKIDKAFVDRVDDADGQGRAVIKSILDLAHSLDLTTVAEGIEVTTQRDALADMGCDNGEGYLLSHPIDARAATALAADASAGTGGAGASTVPARPVIEPRAGMTVG